MTEVTKTPRTLADKLVAAEALVAKLRAEINNEAIRNDIREGDAITFTFGRAEKKRELAGTIVGIKDDETQGKLLRVMVGEGFDAEAYKVNVRDVTSNTTQAARLAADTAEAGDPLSEA